MFNYTADYKAGLTPAMPATLVIKLLSVRVVALIYSFWLQQAQFPPSFTGILFEEKIFQKVQVRYKPAEREVDTIMLTWTLRWKPLCMAWLLRSRRSPS